MRRRGHPNQASETGRWDGDGPQDDLMQDRVRPATADDQADITRLVHQARLNPRGLDWLGFVIAEADGATVGVAQVRRHPDGSRELASLVVLPEHRGHGVAGSMIDALLVDETGPSSRSSTAGTRSTSRAGTSESSTPTTFPARWPDSCGSVE